MTLLDTNNRASPTVDFLLCIIENIIKDVFAINWWLMCAEIAGDFHLGDSRQPTYKNSLPFDSVS